MKKLFCLFFLLFTSISVAQEVNPPRLAVVELKDVSLYEGIELLFLSAGIKNYSIERASNNVMLGEVVLNNIHWDAAIRTISNKYNYGLYRTSKDSWEVRYRR